MPTYDYECQACGHTFEKLQGMTDKILRKCPRCAKPKLARLIGSGGGVIFKGSGFYTTDYRSKGYQDAAKADSGSRDSGSKDSGGKDSGGKDSAPKDAASSRSGGRESGGKEPATPATPAPAPSPAPEGKASKSAAKPVKGPAGTKGSGNR